MDLTITYSSLRHRRSMLHHQLITLVVEMIVVFPVMAFHTHRFGRIPTNSSAMFFPDVTRRRNPLDGSASLVSIDRARELIGFEPEYSISRVVSDG